jgi:hypothetical protein
MAHLSAKPCPGNSRYGLFVVPTLGFDLLYALGIVRLDRSELLWINTLASRSAEWIARQNTEVFPWDAAPRYLIRDQDGIYGIAFRCSLGPMGVGDRPIARGSPWQIRFAERLIGVNPPRLP